MKPIYSLCNAEFSQNLTKCVTGGTDFQCTTCLFFTQIMKQLIKWFYYAHMPNYHIHSSVHSLFLRIARKKTFSDIVTQ